VPDLKQYRICAGSASELVAAIEAGVADGALRPGQALPSIRGLAAEVGLSPATVAAGLADLRRRGVVVTEPRRGSRIGEGPPAAGWSTPLPLPDGVTDLSRGNPDPALLPDLADALRRCPQPRRLYGEAPELAELVEAAGERLRDDGVAAADLCVLSGALDAIDRVLETRLRAGDRVAVEDPGYAALFDLLRARGIKLVPVAIDERGMLPDGLRRALDDGVSAAVITPRGQNPTGAAFDALRAAQLREVLHEHPDVLLVEDDHLGPIAGCELHSLAGATERWAAARSVAKALGPDLRLAVLTGDPTTLGRVRSRQLCGPGWVSHVLQRLVLELWSDAAVETLVTRAGTLYAQRRSALIASLARRGVAARGASGLNVWIEVGDEAAVTAALLQRGWAVAAGARYRLAAGAPAVRVTTAALTGDRCERFAEDLAGVLAPVPYSRAG
jgi:DNA-binding transcriptional MocR family regulator